MGFGEGAGLAGAHQGPRRAHTLDRSILDRDSHHLSGPDRCDMNNMILFFALYLWLGGWICQSINTKATPATSVLIRPPQLIRLFLRTTTITSGSTARPGTWVRCVSACWPCVVHLYTSKRPNNV